MSITILGDKLGDMHQVLMDRVALIELAKAQAVDRHTAATNTAKDAYAAATAAARDAHNAYIETLDAQIAAIRDFIGE